jgi:hypothetical protein
MWTLLREAFVFGLGFGACWLYVYYESCKPYVAHCPWCHKNFELGME